MDANELLMGGGIKAAGFENMGDTVVGTICGEPKAQQMTKFQSNELDFWPSGDPKMQIVVPVQTDQRDPAQADDDGKRMLYITPRMMPAVRDAVKAGYAKGLTIGGRIAVRWVAGTGKAAGDPRQWAAQYVAPVVDPGSLLGNANGNTAPPAAAQEPAPTPGAHPTIKDAWGASDAVKFPELHQAAPAAATPTAGPTLGSMLAGNSTAPAAQAAPPAGVDPAVWAALPDAQRNAVLAAMSNPAASAPAF